MVKEAGSKRFNKSNKKCRDKIICPYKYENGIVKRYSEDFRNAENIFNFYQQKLKLRKADEKAQWFQYGRSWAIIRGFSEKLIIPVAITKSVTSYEAAREAISYAGYFIK